MTIWDTWAKDPRYAQLLTDPTFESATPAFRQQVHDILYNYGISPGSQFAADTGISDASGNPYSVFANLGRSLTQANHNSNNAAGAAGLEESGAAIAAQHANVGSYNQSLASAGAKETGALDAAFENYTGKIDPLWANYEVAPAGLAPPTYDTSAPGSVGVGGSTGRPVPQQPYTRTGPETPSTILGKLVNPKLPKLPQGIGGMGHIT